jgi:hypothetical protein
MRLAAEAREITTLQQQVKTVGLEVEEELLAPQQLLAVLVFTQARRLYLELGKATTEVQTAE